MALMHPPVSDVDALRRITLAVERIADTLDMMVRSSVPSIAAMSRMGQERLAKDVRREEGE